MSDPERPLLFSPEILPSWWTMTKVSPPNPFIIGSVILTAAAMAKAASTALPPALRMSRPTTAASGWLEQAMPSRA